MIRLRAESGHDREKEPREAETRGVEARLALLTSLGQVSPAVAAFVEKTLETHANRLGIRLEGEGPEMMVTHLALALERIRSGQGISEPLEVAEEELRAYPSATQAAAEVAEEARRALGIQLPRAEEQFLALHFAALLVSQK